MRVLLAGGGTAGHINPALAIVGQIKKNSPRSVFLFAGTPAGMEAILIPKAGYSFAPIKVRGFQRSLSPKNVMKNFEAVKCLMTANSRAKKIITEFKPDIVIGTGGYVSGPIVRCAAAMGIKTLIHEQNAYPGFTTKILSKYVDRVMLASGEAKKYLDEKCVTKVVGNPVRESVLRKSRAEARKELNLDENICILSYGGSLGATKLNEIAADIIQWSDKDKEINHIHAYGKRGEEEFFGLLRERGISIAQNPRLDIREYINNMDDCMAVADIVVSRAGAMTLSEITATGKAAILIPSPYVTENHQYHNAVVLEKAGAAIIIEEKDYDRSKLIEFLDDIIKHPQKLEERSEKALSLGVFDTCEKIYSEIIELLDT